MRSAAQDLPTGHAHASAAHEAGMLFLHGEYC